MVPVDSGKVECLVLALSGRTESRRQVAEYKKRK